MNYYFYGYVSKFKSGEVKYGNGFRAHKTIPSMKKLEQEILYNPDIIKVKILSINKFEDRQNANKFADKEIFREELEIIDPILDH